MNGRSYYNRSQTASTTAEQLDELTRQFVLSRGHQLAEYPETGGDEEDMVSSIEPQAVSSR